MWRGQKSKVRTRPTNSNAPSFSSNGPCLVYGQCAATSLWSGLGARCLRVGYLTHVPNWGFKPSIARTRDNVEDFGMFGIYRVYVGDGGDGHDLLVKFDHKGVRIRELDTSI
jgi:hypothetical protein